MLWWLLHHRVKGEKEPFWVSGCIYAVAVLCCGFIAAADAEAAGWPLHLWTTRGLLPAIFCLFVFKPCGRGGKDSCNKILAMWAGGAEMCTFPFIQCSNLQGLKIFQERSQQNTFRKDWTKTGKPWKLDEERMASCWFSGWTCCSSLRAKAEQNSCTDAVLGGGNVPVASITRLPLSVRFKLQLVFEPWKQENYTGAPRGQSSGDLNIWFSMVQKTNLRCSRIPVS